MFALCPRVSLYCVILDSQSYMTLFSNIQKVYY